MKRLALLFLTACFAGRVAFCAAVNPADDLLKQAQAAAGAGKADDAVKLYEQVIDEHPEAVDRWYAAEKGIALALAKKGDLAGAAQAAHLCVDGAPTIQSFDEAGGFAAGILSAIDGKVDRANQLISFQQTGPAGGAVNPMDAIGYPSQPEREKAFAAMRQQAGDNAAASRLRAYTYLFTGKPKEALAQFADAFRRSSTATDMQRSGSDLVLVGLRAVRGHRAGLDKAVEFVSFGPDGPDGKPNTADDIPDPFAGLLPAPPAPGDGGLASLAADDLAALRKVRDAAMLYAGDTYLKADFRRTAFAALQRANDALDDWSADRKGWYLDLAAHAGSDTIDDLIYVGAATAARGGALNFGGARAMWNVIDAAWAANGIAASRGMVRARKQFDMACAALEKNGLQKAGARPLARPASFNQP